MATLIDIPVMVRGCNPEEKKIEEYFGKVSTFQDDMSFAVMTAQEGWEEPAQIAQFIEYIYVIKGSLLIETKTNKYRVLSGQAILINKNEWVKFSTPFKFGANYIAICMPAFQENLIKREK
jgi:mannose-6-phosphate isomerase-like protein (cupin superfamily)